jgi:hypothetical protein
MQRERMGEEELHLHPPSAQSRVLHSAALVWTGAAACSPLSPISKLHLIGGTRQVQETPVSVGPRWRLRRKRASLDAPAHEPRHRGRHGGPRSPWDGCFLGDVAVVVSSRSRRQLRRGRGWCLGRYAKCRSCLLGRWWPMNALRLHFSSLARRRLSAQLFVPAKCPRRLEEP